MKDFEILQQRLDIMVTLKDKVMPWLYHHNIDSMKVLNYKIQSLLVTCKGV